MGMSRPYNSAKNFLDIAEANFSRNHYSNRITQINGCALQCIQNLADGGEKFDLILIDAGKESYGKMLAPSLTAINPGGLLLANDIFMNGDTLNAIPKLMKGEGIYGIIQANATLSDSYTKQIFPIGNGFLLCHKPK
jgi:predicted O-methyltransferase YrrM